MRALVLESFGKLAVADLDEPSADADEVKVRIIATGICGSDLHGYSGANGRRAPGQVMGHETVGVVSAVGPDVTRDDISPGTIVTVNPVVIPREGIEEFTGREQHHPEKWVLGVAQEVVSAFAEYIVVPERNVVPLPYTMPVLFGALVEPLAVAVNAVRRAGITKDDAVLVLGGGPIGQSVILALQMAGVERILVTEVLPERRDLLTALGATVINPTAEPVNEAVRRILGRPADAAIDAVGASPTVNDALSSIKLGGRVCLVGMGQTELTIDAFSVSTAERSIVGSFTYANSDFQAAADWLAGAPGKAALLISRTVDMDGADDAFRSLEEHPTSGKVLVVLTPSLVAEGVIAERNEVLT
ncbi:zinc-binding dehydrogenase [Microbacterium sp. Mu-80]|uniref:Zinc-binding dehydrogenase n=1 Tax=Microbacterium bandirmense TaxID=3122050 RepID=A0ABU8LBF2_9MICO